MILEDLTIDEWLEVRYEEGFEEGMEKAHAEDCAYFLDLLNQGLSTDEIRQQLEQKLRL